MARDAELDRLKAAQDLAFQRKQDAYQAQQRAWERRSSARDAMNRAFEAKQRAYTEQDRTWQHYQSVRSANGPRIDSLNSQQESAFQNMKRSYDAASSAYDRRDGASASSYAAEGRRYKEESQGYVSERRRLVEEIRSARAQHEASKPAFQRAKDDFNAAKRTFDAAKAEHERAQTEFKRAKVDFDQAAKAFKTRLEKVRAEGKKRNEDRQSLARKAGVPAQYLDRVWVSKKPDGTTNLYFGGVGEPNGPGHGHYVLDRSGNVTYRRDPFDPHGMVLRTSLMRRMTTFSVLAERSHRVSSGSVAASVATTRMSSPTRTARAVPRSISTTDRTVRLDPDTIMLSPTVNHRSTLCRTSCGNQVERRSRHGQWRDSSFVGIIHINGHKVSRTIL